MGSLKINLIGENRDYDILINGEKINVKKNEVYEYKNNKEKIDIKLVQNHICDNEKWLLHGIAEFGLGLSGGTRGYSGFEKNRGQYKALCEGTATVREASTLNIKLNETRVKILPLKYTYNFNVNIEGENSKWDERINRFESPEYLKDKWNIIMIPYAILIVFIVIILITIFVR